MTPSTTWASGANAFRAALTSSTAELEEIALLQVGGLAGADHDQALNLDSVRCQDIQRRRALALELVGGGGALDGIGCGPQRLAGGRAELQRIVAEHDENALRGCRKRDEADLDGVGHRKILRKSGKRRIGKPPDGASNPVFDGGLIRQAHGLSPTMACQPRRCKAPWPGGHIR